MPKYNVIFESNEKIYGIVPRAYDWVCYKSILKVKDGVKYPVSLEMTFVPPHPFAFNRSDPRRVGCLFSSVDRRGLVSRLFIFIWKAFIFSIGKIRKCNEGDTK
jgi:hypothetical protein